MEELISVIIPVYNVEKYLDRCMQSVLKQTYRNLEIILVDDGSTDASGKICDEYREKDDRIKVIHKENGGASSARNVGLKIATGNFIGFVDSDDLIVGDMYEYLSDLLHQTNADLVSCCCTTKIKELDYKNKNEVLREYIGREIMELFYRIKGGGSFISPCRKLYKREILENLYFLEGKINEDVLFAYEVCKKAKKIVESNQNKYYYFKNDTGVTRSKLCKKDYALLEIWDEIVNREKNEEYSKWAELNRKRATFTLYVKGIIHGRGKDIDESIMKEWKRELKENYGELIEGKFFDWKRKVLLTMLVVC